MGSGNGKTLEGILAAARVEGELSYYTNAPQAAVRSLVDAFTSKFGIEVRVFQTDTVKLQERVTAEIRAGNLGADVLGTDRPISLALSVHGIFQAWEPPERAAIPDQYKAPEYTVIRLFALAIAWNTNLVEADVAPRSWRDLVDPRWRNRIGLADASGTVVAVQWFDMADKLYGEDYLKAIGDNRPRIFPTPLPVAQALADGELAVGVISEWSIPQLREKGAPVEGVIPDPTCAGGIDQCLLKSGAHPNAAKLFYNFSCSAEGQLAFCGPVKSMTTRPDARVPGAFSLGDIKNIYGSDFLDLSRRQRHIQLQFDRIIKGMD